jgi:hypothetical protein
MLPSLAHKYLVAFLQVAFVVLTSLLTVLAKGPVTATDIWQLVGVGVAALLSVVLPLLSTKQAAVLKVIGAVVGAIIAAAAPILIPGGWSGTNVIIVILAALNAFFVSVGVDVRVDSVAKALADPEVDNTVVTALDPKAAKAAYARAA